jgi:hypothetical protein
MAKDRRNKHWYDFWIVVTSDCNLATDKLKFEEQTDTTPRQDKRLVTGLRALI